MPTAIVTGATGGLGLATACGLARAGRHVVLTGRNPAKGAAALDHVQRSVPGAQAEFRLLDMADLGAIDAFARSWTGPLAVLVNNAGVMAYRQRQTTADGFEAQLGINYLGHFALTMRMLPFLLEGGDARARVVSVSSLAHRRARIDLDDLNAERRYVPFRAYGQSKLAMLIFARALQRRADARQWRLDSIAAHPGWSATDIVGNGLGHGPLGRVAGAGFRVLGQSADAGAQPILFAALDGAAERGGYYGPARLMETRGPTAPSRVMPQAKDERVADRLWATSEALTGTGLPPAG